MEYNSIENNNQQQKDQNPNNETTSKENTKYKPPSKVTRDNERAAKFNEGRQRRQCSEKEDVAIQTEGETSVVIRKDKKKITNFIKKILFIKEQDTSTTHPELKSDRDREKREEAKSSEEGSGKKSNILEVEKKSLKNKANDSKIDPNQIYENFELNLRLSRLEEERHLTMALRHLVRNMHPNGNKITFPTLAEVDRIQLRCINLPTDPDTLKSLIDQVYDRRGETYDLESIYRQFVMTYGRIVIDPKQNWPNSHIHTRHP